MGEHNLALYPGDGIGPEVIREAVKAVEAAAAACGFGVKFTEFDWGHRFWQKTGRVAPEDYQKTLLDFEAILFGAIGHPDIQPDNLSQVPLIRLRQDFELYVNLRPARLRPGVVSPLRDKEPGQIDIVVVRENSEGEYFDAGATFKPGLEREFSFQTAVHTRTGIERILRYSFELARQRRRHLTLATKSNVLRHGLVLWDKVLAEVAPSYGDVKVDKYYIDALCMNFVIRPEQFDVVVGTNLFGDILSDLAGAIVGSLGLAPSANLNPAREYPSLFEPVHGSAPDIAGRGVANPIAAVLSAEMMLDFLGLNEAAGLIEAAVADNLAEGQIRTPDLGGRASTSQVGDDIAARIMARD